MIKSKHYLRAAESVFSHDSHLSIVHLNEEEIDYMHYKFFGSDFENNQAFLSSDAEQLVFIYLFMYEMTSDLEKEKQEINKKFKPWPFPVSN